MILRSERAKAAGWALAALFLRGDVSASLFGRLRAGDAAAAAEAYRWLCDQQPGALELALASTGSSRHDTARAVWSGLCRGCAGPLGPSDLEGLRASIKDPLLFALSTPVGGTLDLIRAARSRLPLALVTLATRADLDRQAPAFHVPLEAFQVIECAGESKADAYRRACRRLSVAPAEAVVFEDSSAGLEAAAAAGCTSIALRDQDNGQDLSRALLVVDDLGSFARPEIIETLAAATPATLRDALLNLLRLL